MRISYAVAKVMAFILLIFAATPGLSAKLASPLSVIALILAWIAIIFCVVRAVPVILESEKLFDN